MPKQDFEFVDYFGPLAVSACFIVALFFLSLLINFTCITKADDRTVFEKFGSTFDIRCGVHRMRHRPDKDEKAKGKLIDNSYRLEVL